MQTQRWNRLRMMVVLSALQPAVALGDVWYVDDSATSGGNTGSNWTNAFVDLQSALAIAHSGDEIRIAQGVYTPALPNGPRKATFALFDGSILRGGYAGVGSANPDANDPLLFVTTLSGDLHGDDLPYPNLSNHAENVYHVVTAHDVKPSASVFGLTIRGGFAMDFDPPLNLGGGVYTTNSVLFFDSVTIEGNAARLAGGGICSTATLAQSVVHLYRCTLRQNRLPFLGSGSGAAVSAGIGSTFTNCAFIENATGPGKQAGAIAGGNLRIVKCDFIRNYGEDGGALMVGDSSIIDSRFIDNNCSYRAGAIWSSGNTRIINCDFLRNNFALEGGAVAIRSSVNQASIINCRFSGNRALDSGGGAVLNDGRVLIANCTIVGNETGTAFGNIRGAVHTRNGGQTILRNNLLWGNLSDGNASLPAQFNQESNGTTELSYSTVQGLPLAFDPQGNSGADPLLLDPNGIDNIFGTLDDNPRLSSASPARETGDNAVLPADLYDLDNDGNVDELMPYDLDAHRRVVGRVIDRGCFEYQTCPADIAPLHDQGDGVVNVADLMAVITAWGEGVGSNPADIVPDGLINVIDLLTVIAGWGPCR